MKISKSLRNTLLKLMAVVMVFTTLAAVPATQANAASNKALKITASFGGETLSPSGRAKNTYYVDALYKKQVKLKKNMTMQSTVYIPQSLLSGINNRFYLLPEIMIYDGLSYVGSVSTPDNVLWLVVNDGNGVVGYEPGPNENMVKTSKMKISKSGKYYKITTKWKMANKSVYNGKSTNIKTNKSYQVVLSMHIFGSQVNGTGTFYVDDLKLSSKPSVSLNFSKKDFSATASTGDNKKVKVSTAKIK